MNTNYKDVAKTLIDAFITKGKLKQLVLSYKEADQIGRVTVS